jgi:hypothetical protein
MMLEEALLCGCVCWNWSHTIFYVRPAASAAHHVHTALFSPSDPASTPTKHTDAMQSLQARSAVRVGAQPVLRLARGARPLRVQAFFGQKAPTAGATSEFYDFTVKGR